MEAIAHLARDRGAAQGASTCIMGAATGCLQVCRWQLQVADWSSEQGKQVRVRPGCSSWSQKKKPKKKWRQREDIETGCTGDCLRRREGWMWQQCRCEFRLRRTFLWMVQQVPKVSPGQAAVEQTGDVNRPELLHIGRPNILAEEHKGRPQPRLEWRRH